MFKVSFLSRFVGNIIPADMKALISAVQQNKWAEALSWHRKLFPLCRDMLGIATNPIPIKSALKLLGRGTGELRLPMTPLDSNQISRLKQTLENYGLLPKPC